MKQLSVRVPLRVDLAGGTLDLWPLYLFHPGSRTVNAAISLHAECEVIERGDSSIEIFLGDHRYHKTYDSLSAVQNDSNVALVARVLEYFKVTGVTIRTRSEAPRGSGLGGSSALAVAATSAISHFIDAPIEGDALIRLVRDLETRLIAAPAGIQDYYPSVYGGLSSLHLDPGEVRRHALSLPVSELAKHLVVHYSGVAHFSGTNNWEIYKRTIEGDREISDGLQKISAISVAMERALDSDDIEAAAKALGDEWNERRALIRGISTPEIDKALAIATKAGAWAGKVCGAGGGGCIVFLAPEDKRDDVVAALAKAPGRVLDVQPVSYGLELDSAKEAAPAAAYRVLRRGAIDEPLEQLFLSTDGKGDYLPYILAEYSVRYDESRSGVRAVESRCVLAPVDVENEKVDWTAAQQVDPDALQLSAVPDPKRKQPAVDTDVLLAAAADGEEVLRAHVAETQRLKLYSNPAFAMYSEAHESRDSFLTRCFEEAERRLGERKERLESTFRRRIDQLREKSERDQREMEDADESDGEVKQGEVAIAWGQALYKMTSGRAPVTDAPQSVSEADYLEKIALLQKTWDRDFDVMKSELDDSARQIEEIVVAPPERNIEIVKYVIVWSPA